MWNQNLGPGIAYAMLSPMIRVKSLSKQFDRAMAVDNVNFEVQAGQTLCLIGSSGSGKTTTLKMLNRLIEPSQGKIWIKDQDILQQDPVRLRRKMGYIIQQAGLFPHMTVAKNIGLILELEGWNKNQIRTRVQELLSLVQMPPEDYATRYPAELSGGQRQRVGVARALALNPPIILMDEPFGALDPITRTQVQDGFLEIQKQFKVTAVMVTHDMAEAFKCGDIIGIMDHGKLLQLGTPLELLNQPVSEFVSEFVRSQTGLDQLMDLPVAKLCEKPDPNQGWMLTKSGEIEAWKDAQGHRYSEIPKLQANATLQNALKQLLRLTLPGLPVYAQDDFLGVLNAEEICKLL